MILRSPFRPFRNVSAALLALWICLLLTVHPREAQAADSFAIAAIAQLQYGGGGDWYANPSSLPNLLKFARRETGASISPTPGRVRITDPELFAYPIIYMTGHGNVRFSDEEVVRLRRYLLSGGFLHADDNYGLDESFRREMRRVFPDNALVELPFDHPIYRSWFVFPSGLPKIHEHDGKPAQGFGIFAGGRLVVFYSYESDLGDGWEDQHVHNDPEEKRLEALRMGTNILLYALTH